MSHITCRMAEAGKFFYEDPGDPDHAFSAFRNEGDGLTLSICEEQAVDSYNAMFDLFIALPHSEAVRLRDYLNAHFPPTKE